MTCVAAGAAIDDWFLWTIDPGPFDASLTPSAPDYTRASAWAARPDMEDEADLALADDPAVDQVSAEVQAFYLHPTTALGPWWNAPIDDAVINLNTARGGTAIQASAFNGCCGVWAPRYRQAHARAFVDPSEDGAQARAVALADVEAAFDHFLSEIGDRPFIIVGHSQGAFLAMELLARRIAESPLQRRLVAAYLPGAPVRGGDLGPIPLCETPTQTGCAVTWHARGPRYRPNGLEFDAEDPDTMRTRACVNPLSWTMDGSRVPASKNPGAVFFDASEPRRKPGFADAQCDGGTMLVRDIGDLERDSMGRLLLWVTGPQNYHAVEVQLFYDSIRANAKQRVQAFHPQGT